MLRFMVSCIIMTLFRLLGFPLLKFGAAQISQCYPSRLEAERARTLAKMQNPGWAYTIMRVDAEGRAA